MSGPVANIPRNVERELNDAMEDQSGWDWFKNHFVPAAVADTFRPDDHLLIELAKFADTTEGRKIIDWLHDLTDRAPYPMVDGMGQQVALAAAKHMGRAGVGHVLTNAVKEGRKLIELKRKEEAHG